LLNRNNCYTTIGDTRTHALLGSAGCQVNSLFKILLQVKRHSIITFLFTSKKEEHVLQSVMRRKRRTRGQAAAPPAYPISGKGTGKHLQNRNQL
jgi:hypothetical protein